MKDAGRNERGQFVRDDETIKDALAALIAAVDPLIDFMAHPAMDAGTRIKAAHEAAQSLGNARALLAMIDVGEKPGKDQP